MSDALRQLREQQRQRYEAAKRENKIPEVRKCADCGEPTYTREVCPITGVLHDLEKKKIVGGSIVKSNVISSAQLMSAIDSTRVRWVPSRTQLVRVDAHSLNIFQSFASQMNWNLQRYGVLYGRYRAEGDEEATAGPVVEVHAVYEPEQHGNAYTFEVTSDPHGAKVDAIAAALGLRRVGVVCTHPPRNAEAILLSYRELLVCAQQQSLYGDECVLLTVAPNEKEGGVVECQAWQVSPQCVQYFRLGVLQEPTSSSSSSAATEASNASPLQNIETAKTVHCTIPLEVTQTDTDNKGHQKFITKAPSTEIDTRWFTSYIAVQQFESPVVRGLFMRLSRPGMPPPTPQNIKNYCNDPKRAKESFVAKMSDFHILVYVLTQILTTPEDLQNVCEAVRTQKMTPMMANYEAILLGS